MRFKELKDDVKKSRIFEATFECIYKMGARATTMRSIARSANVSQALVHYYFNNKENLLSEFIKIVLDKLVEGLQNRLVPADTAISKLDVFFDYGQDYAEKNADIILVVQEIWAISIRDPLLKAAFSGHIEKMARIFEDILAQGERENTFKTVRKDFQALHRTYFAFFIGMGIILQVDRSSSSESFVFVRRHLNETILKTP